VNTDYWRPKLARNVARDRAVDSALQAAGWRVLRAWEHEPPASVADRVEKMLRVEAGTATRRAEGAT
jgi:DNA mismatch endonuclease (patch repair protein)